MNAESYFNVLLMLRDAIYRKRSGLLTKGIFFHQGNATLYTARLTQDRTDQMKQLLLGHP